MSDRMDDVMAISCCSSPDVNPSFLEPLLSSYDDHHDVSRPSYDVFLSYDTTTTPDDDVSS